jgi:pyrroline-5-carboxylate reductase
MKVGIIGYGSMGSMLAGKFTASGKLKDGSILVSNRTKEKLSTLPDGALACSNNNELAAQADIIFLCAKPGDMREIIEEIRPVRKQGSMLVSLNGSISFATLEKIADGKIAKVIPSVTAEINRSQTLICYNRHVEKKDKAQLEYLLACIGEIIELPEHEMGMGSELVSCMPGFIASMMDVICHSAEKHTEILPGQVARMVLKTMTATGELMLKNNASFEEIITRVATRGGITEEGIRVIYEQFPAVADQMFGKTLEKRKQTAKAAEEMV